MYLCNSVIPCLSKKSLVITLRQKYLKIFNLFVKLKKKTQLLYIWAYLRLCTCIKLGNCFKAIASSLQNWKVCRLGMYADTGNPLTKLRSHNVSLFWSNSLISWSKFLQERCRNYQQKQNVNCTSNTNSGRNAGLISVPSITSTLWYFNNKGIYKYIKIYKYVKR